MKFFDLYLSTAARVMSAIFGALTGLLVGFISGVWQYGVLAGAVTALAMSLLLPISLYRRELPYRRIKETIKKPFLMDERVRFTVRGGTVGGYLILTDSSMILLSLEGGDHRLELCQEDVTMVTCNENMSISIFLNEKQYIRVITHMCTEVCEVLRQNGWRVSSSIH
jgi:hypothetical protein